MAPYYASCNVKLDHISPSKEVATYSGNIDREWAIGTVPHGGYLQGIILKACCHFQAGSNHLEPLYFSSQFIGASKAAPYTITIKLIKAGRSMSNLIAELSQEGRINIQAQIIYGTLPFAKHPFGPFPATRDFLTLEHPSQLSRRCPIATHPSRCKAVYGSTRPVGFVKYYRSAEDQYYRQQNYDLSQGLHNGGDPGGGILKWGGWFEFLDEKEVIDDAALALFCDMALNTLSMLPKEMRTQVQPMWFPSLAITLDFKYRIPSLGTPGVYPRAVGVYVTSKFTIEGRHDIYIEVWTSPGPIGSGIEEKGWREKQVPLVVGNQVGLTVPMSVNLEKAKAKAVEAKL